MSSRPEPQEAAAGSALVCPARGSHPFHWLPSNHLCQTCWSLPSTTTSSRPALQEATDGDDARTPPSGSHPLHWLPSNHLCQSCWSVPRTKTSSRPELHEATPGPEVSVPPSGSHPLHCPLENQMWYICWSLPRTKASSRSGDQEAAAGLDVRTPPSDCQRALGDTGRGRPAVVRSRLTSSAEGSSLTTRYSDSPFGNRMVISRPPVALTSSNPEPPRIPQATTFSSPALLRRNLPVAKATGPFA